MNYLEAVQQLPSMERIDLMDFGDLRLSEAGELDISRQFSDTIILELGKDLVELSRASLPTPERNRSVGLTACSSLYILRNLSDPTNQGSLLFSDELEVNGDVSIENATTAAIGRQTVMLGRSQSASPELRLSNSVSRHHMQIRIDTLASNLHFADLYSKNGTRVYLSQRDALKKVGMSPRYSRTDPLITLAEERGGWARK